MKDKNQLIKVQLFIPCFVDQFFPYTALNMVKILKKLGCTVSYNAEQTCCGQPAFNAGYREECYAVACKFMKDFDTADYIVAPSGSCVGFVRNYYQQLFTSDTRQQQLPQLQEKLFEFTEFLTQVLQVNEVGATLHGTGTYHDACGALRECGIRQAPRELLSKVKGLELKEAPDCEVCCGFGGTFAVKFEPISIGMGEQKVLNAVATKADYLISTDLSCLMHLDGYIRKQGYSMKTMHIADVLASGW